MKVKTVKNFIVLAPDIFKPHDIESFMCQKDVGERYSAYLSDDGYMQFGGHDTQGCS